MEHSHPSGSLVALLRRRGYRITAARAAIAQLMEQSAHPLSALEIHARLRRKNVRMNKVTAYRELRFLEGQGLLMPVQFDDGIKRYEAASLPHHHHLVCTQCKSVQDIEIDRHCEGLEAQIHRQKSFTVASHALEFYGLCGRCGG